MDHNMDHHMDAARPPIDARRAPRVKLSAMYTQVRVRPVGSRRYCWSGHIYDISASGMRFELDATIQPGTEVEIRALLPGSDHPIVTATGRIVRLHGDTDEPGPVRMGMAFDTFARHTDRLRLDAYVARRLRLRPAA